MEEKTLILINLILSIYTQKKPSFSMYWALILTVPPPGIEPGS